MALTEERPEILELESGDTSADWGFCPSYKRHRMACLGFHR